ncbi:MAG: hypothetical protein KZQ70_15535, partial [gamma proteobacterium symbiont of Lucinoma myriamae]|nr:hypothetical protein [gamma proteobacterium symbiont of Lucinoma myriamae]
KQDQIDKITRDTESPEITKITRNTESPKITSDTHINVYKNYIPLCFVGIVGLGAYIYFSWRPTDKPADKAQTVNLTPATQKERDLFDF